MEQLTRIGVVVAAQGAQSGAALHRTLCAIAIQCGVTLEITAVLPQAETPGADKALLAVCPKARVARLAGPWNADAARALGARESAAPYVMLQDEGDALFDAYSLWRLCQPLRQAPGLLACRGGLDCVAPDGAKDYGPANCALPFGTLWRRDALLTALDSATETSSLSAWLFARRASVKQIDERVCEHVLRDPDWPDSLARAANLLESDASAAAVWAETCLSSLYLAHLRACVRADESAQAITHARCARFFARCWAGWEASLPPEALMASYGETMEAASRIDPDGTSDCAPYPFFLDELKAQS